MGNDCCKARWNPCPGLDVHSNAVGVGPRFQINREPFWRQKFLLGDKAISTPIGLQNAAYHEDADLPLGKTRSSNDWVRPTLTVPTEAVAAAIAAATAATAPVPPPRTKRKRRCAPLPLPDTPEDIVQPVTTASYPQKDYTDIGTTTKENLKDPTQARGSKNNTALPEQPKNITKKVPTDEPKDKTEDNVSVEPMKEKSIESQGVVNCVELPSVDENSILNCSNTVDLLRTVMQRHTSTEGEAPDQKLDFSDDYPIAPPKKKTQTSEERKGSSVSLPGDDVLAKTITERSRLSKFKFSKKEKEEFDLSIAGTEEHEREELKSRIRKNVVEDDNESSTDTDSEQEEVFRRSSESSATLEPYETACSGDDTKETPEQVDGPSLRSLSPPPIPENSPRRGSIDEFTDVSIVTQRSVSESSNSITRSMSPNLTHIALSKSAILLTPRQWKTPHSSSLTPERDENVPEVQVTMEPSDHQINTRIAMTSFMKGTYSDKLEVPERPDSVASSNAGSLGELEEDIYKLLSESKDKLCDDDDDDDDYTPLKLTPMQVHTNEEIKPAIPDAPTVSSAELVRKQQELYIRSMREIRNENGKQQ